MGFLSDLFGSKPQYPTLDPDSPVNEELNMVRSSIESLTQQVKDPLEVVPAGGNAYVYIGKPPKHFGVAWVEQGEVKNLKMLAQEKGLSPSELTALQEKLRTAYEQHLSDPRFVTKIGGRDIVVIPSDGLEEDFHGIISSATKH